MVKKTKGPKPTLSLELLNPKPVSMMNKDIADLRSTGQNLRNANLKSRQSRKINGVTTLVFASDKITFDF